MVSVQYITWSPTPSKNVDRKITLGIFDEKSIALDIASRFLTDIINRYNLPRNHFWEEINEMKQIQSVYQHECYFKADYKFLLRLEKLDFSNYGVILDTLEK